MTSSQFVSAAQDTRPRVVIVGGGFGGLAAARALRRAPVRVTMVDRRNHHVFQPLLYQVATAALSPADIAQPIRHILRDQENTEVLLGEVRSISPAEKVLSLSDGAAISYDYLILATGATHSYFGKDAWEARAPGLKTLEDAVAIRSRFLTVLEKAEREQDPEARRRLLTFVIVGAGPTGVELAGTMAQVARRTMRSAFRRIRHEPVRVILVEAGARVLGAFPEDLSAKALGALEKIGVEVRFGKPVTEIAEDHVLVGGERIDTRNVFWAAGVKASPVAVALGAPMDRAGRVVVNDDCSVPDHPEAFVIGDLAAMKDAAGRPVPGVAQGAMQSGAHAARMILADLAGRPRKPFRYIDKGNMATIGRAAAVADIKGLRFSGIPAWLFWLFLHLLFLIGLRSKLLVLVQWVWAYIHFDMGVRLITQYGEREH